MLLDNLMASSVIVAILDVVGGPRCTPKDLLNRIATLIDDELAGWIASPSEPLLRVEATVCRGDEATDQDPSSQRKILVCLALDTQHIDRSYVTHKHCAGHHRHEKLAWSAIALDLGRCCPRLAIATVYG